MGGMKLLLFVFLFSQVWNYLYAIKCVNPKNNCACETDANGQVVDFSSLDKHSIWDPRFSVYYSPRSLTVKYNPCTGIWCQSTSNSAVCVSGMIGSSSTASTGDQPTAKFIDTNDPNTIIIQYTSKDTSVFPAKSYTSSVTFKCQPTASTNPTMTVDSVTNNDQDFGMTVLTNTSCVTYHGGGGGGSGLGVGSILLIVVAVIVVLYMAAGVLVMKFYFKETGINLVPNLNIWIALWQNMAAGAIFCKNFIMSKIRPGSDSTYQAV